MADFDVVIFRTNDIVERELWLREPPIRQRINLGQGMFMERLPESVAEKIARRCNAGGAISTVAHQYAFVREYGPGEPVGDFDPDERLQIAIALSRLVRPTSVGLEQSAQVRGSLSEPDGPTEIRPGLVCGPAAQAWVADSTSRDWLTPTEAGELRRLLDVYFTPDTSKRVIRALWFHEFAARTLDRAARWTLVATGLEALINTDNVVVTKQFADRSSAIAAECGVPLNRRDASQAYRLRSQVIHGKVTGFGDEELALYVRMERVLREALKKSFQDSAWARNFETDETVRAKWPVPIEEYCRNCGQRLRVEPGENEIQD